MDKQTEQRLLDLADSLPPIEVPVPSAPEPEPEPEPEPAKLLGQTPDGVPVMVPMAPAPPDASWYAPQPVGIAPSFAPRPAPDPGFTAVIPGMRAPLPRGRVRHAEPARHWKRFLIAFVILVPLVTAAVLVATHSLSLASRNPPPFSPAPAGPSPSAAPHSHSAAPSHTSSSLADVPGVPAAFAACVAFTASADGTASRNVYGITPASGINVAGQPLSFQKAAFAALYKRYGAAPWKSYKCSTV